MEEKQSVLQKGEKASTRKAYGEALVTLGKKNEKIVVLDADLSCSTQTAIFRKEYPERFFNMGVAEQDMIGTAAGLAASGKIPFASTFAVFASGRAWDQVRQAVCYSELNVNIAATHGGITVGEDGATHQAIEDMALMRALPNMTVIVPSDYHEATAAVIAAAYHDGPCYIRLSRPNSPIINEERVSFTIGKAKTLISGNDVTIIGIGLMVPVCLDAAKLLADRGISARVINMSTLKPLDTDAVVCAAKETGAVVTVEEHSIIGGLGSAVAETLGCKFPVPMEIVGINDRFGVSGKPDELLKEYGLTPENIKEKTLDAIKKKLYLEPVREY